MRTLHLLRHAKSSWKDQALADHDRPLAPRGRRATRRMADHMRGSGIRPEAVLCSPALRARQTLGGISAALAPRADVTFDEALYGATAGVLLQRVQQMGDTIDELLLIGHNPALHDLAVQLATEGDERLVSRLREKLPTCALVTLVWAGTWVQLVPGNAVLHDLVVPRDLPA
ncbi:MAG: SixA phosphatase family protein [Actinomycetes bacterium]